MTAFAQVSPAVLVHLVTAIFALGLGAVVLMRPKGTRVHKAMGRLWVALLTVIALSSFWITEIRPGAFSAIHLLSVLTLVSLVYAIISIRRGRVRAHKTAMLATYVAGLVGAGLGALAPGRFLSRLFFGG